MYKQLYLLSTATNLIATNTIEHMTKFKKMDWHLTNLEKTLLDLINFGKNLDIVINPLKFQISILEEDNKYIGVQYDKMKVNEDGVSNLRLEL